MQRGVSGGNQKRHLNTKTLSLGKGAGTFESFHCEGHERSHCRLVLKRVGWGWGGLQDRKTDRHIRPPTPQRAYISI